MTAKIMPLHKTPPAPPSRCPDCNQLDARAAHHIIDGVSVATYLCPNEHLWIIRKPHNRGV